MTAVTPLGPLTPGSRVALLSVSGQPSPAQVVRGVELLRSWGLQPVERPTLTARHPHASYLAGSDELRARDFEDAWCDPSIDGIFFVRGGYGSIRVIDLLDADRMRAARPKPIYGSSDVTLLQGWMDDHLGLTAWFTPMIATADLLDDERATEQLREAVVEDWRGRVLTREGSESIVRGEATGRLIGGNLSLLALMQAARRNPPTSRRGTIVLLEDVFEDTYKIDGFLQQLLRAGWFEDAEAILLGSWKKCEPAEIRPLVEELLTPLGVPLVWEFGFGHGAGASSIPLGIRARLEAYDEPRLTLLG